MVRSIVVPSHRLPVSPLNPTTFSSFGEVTQNPDTHDGQPALQSAQANQGTATKWLNITQMEHYYQNLPRKRQKAKCSMNMFVCRPRALKAGRIFNVGIMERHPYTPQTFVPMGLSKEDKETTYLVIVAPSLPYGEWANCDAEYLGLIGALKDYRYQSFLLESQNLQRRRNLPPRSLGPPDMANLRAFIARGDQAVTYGAGTWHAPMVVLGEREVEFVVVQYVNGNAHDDVQEVGLSVRDGGDGVEVDVGAGIAGGNPKL